MFVVMAYDVGEKRVKKANHTAQKYLLPVQRSLFQGYLTDKQLHRLQSELASILIPEEDRVVFYKTRNDKSIEIDELGLLSEQEMIL